jgi:hypothetical protein
MFLVVLSWMSALLFEADAGGYAVGHPSVLHVSVKPVRLGIGAPCGAGDGTTDIHEPKF